MAIAFDATTGAQDSDNSVTFAHTIGSGSNRIAMIMITGTGPDNASVTLSTVTYNGVAATQLVNTRYNAGTFYLYAIFYVLEANLPSAGTYNVVCTGGSGQYTIDASCTVLTGAFQGAPTSATNSAGGVDSISTNISTTENDSWLCDVLYAYYGLDDPTLAGTDQVIRIETRDFEIHASSTKPIATAGATSASWQNGNAANWSTIFHAIAAIKPAGGGGGPAAPTPNVFMFGANF